MTASVVELSLMGLVALALVFLVVTYVRKVARTRRAQRSLGRLDDGAVSGATSPAEGAEPSHFKSWIRAAGLPSNPGVFLVVVIIIPTLVALLAFRLLDGALGHASVAFALAVHVVRAVHRELFRRRALHFEEKLVDGIDLLAGALRGGENPPQAIASAASASGNPVRAEFREVCKRLQLGMPIRRAVARMVERYDSEGVRLFTNTLTAKWTTGGDMAPVVLAVNRMMRDRLRHRLRLRAQLAGAWIAAIMTAVSPYMVVLVFRWRQPDWLDSLMAHPSGPSLLFMAVCLQVVGFVWLYRIMRSSV